MTTRQRNTTATSQGNNSETEEIGPATTARAAPPDDDNNCDNNNDDDDAGARDLPKVAFPPMSRRPVFCCYDRPFTVDSKHYKAGVYYHYVTQKDENGKKSKNKRPVDLWICSVLRVQHIVRTGSGNEHGYLLEYMPHGETEPRRAVLSQALLLGRGDEAMKELRDLGVSVLHDNADLVRKYLDREHLKFSRQQTPDDFWDSVKVIGWSHVGEQFVLPNETLGRDTGVWFNGKMNVAQYSKKGDFFKWNAKVAAPCEGNSYLIVALSCAFAGPLLEPLNIPGLGIHFFGDSTTGKSTSLAVAASVWGSEKFMISWRTTVNGLEIQAASRSSTLIPVDESHQVDAKTLDASVYMLLNGMGKSRMRQDTSAREIAHWYACVLSSGERSIETHQTAAKIDHKVGQIVRITDVPVAIGPLGLFEDIHESKNAADFSGALRDAAARHYGHAGPMFVSYLIENYKNLGLSARLAKVIEEFGTNLSAQDARVARSFAVIALAGELAIEWAILPWEPGSVTNAAVDIYNYWRSTQPQSAKSKETAQLIAAVKAFIETRDADFSNADWMPEYDEDSGRIINPEPVIRERAGYRKEINDNRVYCFNVEGLKRASSNFGARKAAEILDAAGALVEKDPGKKTKKIWIPQLKRSVSFYVVDPEKLDLP